MSLETALSNISWDLYWLRTEKIQKDKYYQVYNTFLATYTNEEQIALQTDKYQ